MPEDSVGDQRPASQRPRSPRVPVDFRVGLEYSDAAGKWITESASAVRVSRGGATLISEVPIANGAIVRLTPPFGRTIDAEVNGVWVDETDGKQRIGVKLLDANGWFAD